MKAPALEPEGHYDVFISYRTGIEFDSEVAKVLQETLERFPVPSAQSKFVASPGRWRTRLRVFRDKTDLNASPDIDEGLREKLRQSRYLIVVGTTDFPKSSHCSKEVEYFRQCHGIEQILLLLASGEPGNSLPNLPFSGEATPLWIDVRGNLAAEVATKLIGKEVPRAERPIFKLLAPIVGCTSPNQLVQRDRQRRKEEVIQTGVLFFAFLVIIALPKLTYDFFSFELGYSKARFEGDNREVVIKRVFNPFGFSIGTWVFEDELISHDAREKVESGYVLSAGVHPDWLKLNALLKPCRRHRFCLEQGWKFPIDIRDCLNDSDQWLIDWARANQYVREELKKVAGNPENNWIVRVRAIESLQAVGINVPPPTGTDEEKAKFGRYQMAKMSESLREVGNGNPFSRMAVNSELRDQIIAVNQSLTNDADEEASKIAFEILSCTSDTKLDAALDSFDPSSVGEVLEIFSIYVASRDERIRKNAIESIGRMGQNKESHDAAAFVQMLSHHQSHKRLMASIVLAYQTHSSASIQAKLDELSICDDPLLRQSSSFFKLFVARINGLTSDDSDTE